MQECSASEVTRLDGSGPGGRTRERDAEAEALTDVEWVVGSRLGRYEVLEPIGAGGMGRVFRAHDPKLGRDVALKLIRRASVDGLQRMRREAKAMAQLSHPNVLPIYDVGERHDRLFIAMELVQGQTLRRWLRGASRPWEQIIEPFMAAGRGLAAAHAAGLVHRDFNPANVLIGDDGRVRVMDFGLARITSELSPSSESLDEADDEPASSKEEITAVGFAVGTPAYMAPEQHCGESAGPEADQYAFCLSLWEALTGSRPFTGSSMRKLGVAKLEGPPPSPRALRALPRRIERALRRGLAPKPAERHASMDALLSALTGPARRPARRWAMAAAVVVAATGAVQLYAARGAETCDGAGQRLEGVWDPATRDEVEAAIVATGWSYAPRAWERLEVRLDDYTAQWSQAYRTTCEAAQQGMQTAAQLDARMLCLADLRQQLGGLVHTLRSIDRERLGSVLDGALRLPAVERCEDARWLSEQAPVPDEPSLAAEVARLRERLAQISARRAAGAMAGAVDDARLLLREAVALGHAPLVVDVRVELGRCLRTERDPAAAAVLEQAFFDAQAEGLDRPAALAAIEMVTVAGSITAKPEDAERWAEHARGLVERIADPELPAYYHQAVGMAWAAKGDHAGAIEQHDQARALLVERYGAEDVRVASAETRLGNGHLTLGHTAQAREYLVHALGIYERALGERSPNVAAVLQTLGNVQRREDDLDGAVATFERARSIYEDVFGPDHPQVAAVLNNLGGVAFRQDRYERASDLFERSLSIRRRALGPEHPEVAKVMMNIAAVARAQGRLERAEQLLGEALEVYEGLYGVEHPMVAGLLNNLANVKEQQGQLEDAVSLHEQALSLYEKLLGPETVETLRARTNLERVQGKLRAEG